MLFSLPTISVNPRKTMIINSLDIYPSKSKIFTLLKNSLTNGGYMVSVQPKTTGMLWWKKEVPQPPKKGPNMKEVSEAMLQALDAYLGHLKPKDRRDFKARITAMIVSNDPPTLSEVLNRIERVSTALRAA
jgi:hypothetical protein